MKQKNSHSLLALNREFYGFFPVQVNLACTALILKEANTANEGLSK